MRLFAQKTMAEVCFGVFISKKMTIVWLEDFQLICLK